MRMHKITLELEVNDKGQEKLLLLAKHFGWKSGRKGTKEKRNQEACRAAIETLVEKVLEWDI